MQEQTGTAGAERRGAYWQALYLTSAISLIHAAFFAYLLVFNVAAVERKMLFYLAVALAVLFGIWIGSNLARYVGAIFFLISFGGVILGLFLTDRFPSGPGLVWLIVMGALSLAAAWLLLLSRRFAQEFAEVRRTLPGYKRTLRGIAVAAVVTVALVATARDIYQVFLAPP